MKALFASLDAGLFGLSFFFLTFVGIAIWAMLPAQKDRLEAHKYIPLSGDDA